MQVCSISVLAKSELGDKEDQIQREHISTMTFSKFGELVQGVTTSGLPFLIAGNVRRGPFTAHATFSPNNGSLSVHPSNKVKAKKAIEELQAWFNAKGLSLPSGVVNIVSNIPVGGGLGSSSADISVTLRLLLKVTGYDMNPQDLYKLFVKVERSDPVDIKTGRIILAQQTIGNYWDLGTMPSMTVVAAQVCNTPVETTAVAYLDSERKKYTRYYERMIEKIRSRNLKHIGWATTMSSIVNQEFPELRKPYFNEFIDLSKITGSVGVVCAHTGQFLGILYDSTQKNLKARIVDSSNGLKSIGLKPLIFHY